MQEWIVHKPLARSKNGVVASQNRIASEIGAGVLTSGGNAVDAAVAAGFALAAVEPWNSGLGGVGYMLIYLANEDRVQVVDFGPVSPKELDPADYPLVGGDRTDLFTWPAVQSDRNVRGPTSFAVPGQIDGLGLALERFGTITFAEALAPALEQAKRGIAVDWYLSLRVATMARELIGYPKTRQTWLPDGLPPVTAPEAPIGRLKLTGLAETLDRLATSGRRDFYEGEIAARIVDDIRDIGGVIEPEDLQDYYARLVPPLECEYRGAIVSLAPGLTSGPSMHKALGWLEEIEFPVGKPNADAFVAYAEILRRVYADRLQLVGDTADRRDPSSTTHLNVIDRNGNLVALTQTLLSVFGSKVVLPGTGILMNNGIMWFDPRPGRPNSIGPAKRPLTNMCPMIARRNKKGWFAIGASGGRKILPAVMQISSFLIDHEMNLTDAFHQPRIDESGNEKVTIDPRLPKAVRDALAQKFKTQCAELSVYPAEFACPSAVLFDDQSEDRFGITDTMSPWSRAVAESE